jgi:uncharacterized cupin superfamily protein
MPVIGKFMALFSLVPLHCHDREVEVKVVDGSGIVRVREMQEKLPEGDDVGRTDPNVA